MDLGGGMMAAHAPGSALRLTFERVTLDSPAPPAAAASDSPLEDSQAGAQLLPDPLDAPPAWGGASLPFSQEVGLFWCVCARGGGAAGSKSRAEGGRPRAPCGAR